MTRINCVDPKILHNQHLLIEYRELPRVFNLARWIAPSKRVPDYTMGEGHVKFFYDKLEYLVSRQQLLINELKRRGYTLTFNNPDDLRNLNTQEFLYNDWQPEEKDIKVNLKRLLEKKPIYYGKYKDKA